MKKRNKLLLSLGSTLAIATPIAAVLSCGSQNKFQINKQLSVCSNFENKHNTQNQKNNTVVMTDDFFKAVENTITFSGRQESVSVNDNAALNAGLPNATLNYCWTWPWHTIPVYWRSDYHQIKNMEDGYTFWVVVTPNQGIPMGEGQSTTLKVQVVSTVYTKDFFDAVRKTITFSGEDGSVVPDDNAVLNAGVPNATLDYVWMNMSHSGQIVKDYHQIKGMSDKDKFGIRVKPNAGIPFGPGQDNIITIPVTVSIYTDAFFNKVNSAITFLGKDGSVVPNDNEVLNVGLPKATLKYGWSLSTSQEPQQYVTDYHQLKGMSISNILWIVVTPNDGYYLAPGQQNQLKIKVVVDVYTQSFFQNVQNTITFSGAQGSVLVNDNAALNAGVPNATLKYGWTSPGHDYPEGFVTDYHQLKNMNDGYKFWIIVTPLPNFTMGEGQQTTLQIVVASNVSIRTQQFFSYIQSTISFSGNSGSVSVDDNEYLDVGLKNTTLKYGWTSPGQDQPSIFVTDYHQLKNMSNGYMFWVVVVPNPGYHIGEGQETTLIIQIIT